MLLKFLIQASFLTVIQCNIINRNNIEVEEEAANEPHDIVRRSNLDYYFGPEDYSYSTVWYITPQNVDEMLKFIQPPNWKEIKHRKRPYSIFVEGIVGTGKSTFLESFQNYPNMEILPEPVSKWTNLNGTDVLGLVYKNPYRWAMTQESLVQLTMLQEHLESNTLIKAMERSIHSARHVFNEYFYQSGKMKSVEYALLDSWYQFLNDKYTTGFDLSGDLIFYLQADPVAVMDRIKKRGRPEERTITLEFLQGLNRLHEDWLIHRNTTAKVPAKKVFVVNTNHNFYEMQTVYRKIAEHIFQLMPKELLPRC